MGMRMAHKWSLTEYQIELMQKIFRLYYEEFEYFYYQWDPSRIHFVW